MLYVPHYFVSLALDQLICIFCRLKEQIGNMKVWAALSDELDDPSTTSSRTSLKRQTRDTGCQAAVRTENEEWKDYTLCHVTDKGEVAYIDASRSEPFEKRI